MRKAIGIFLALAVALILGLVPAMPASAATSMWFGVNYYELVFSPNTPWTAANAAASAMTRTFDGMTYRGHLAVITSEAENNAIYNNLVKNAPQYNQPWQAGRAWIGGYQLPNQSATNVGWYWVTGQSVASGYTKWDTAVHAGDSPVDSPGDEGGNGAGLEDNSENYMEMRGDGYWDDLANNVGYPGYDVNYVVEFEPLVLNGSFEKPVLANDPAVGGVYQWFTDPSVTDWNSSPAPGFEIQRSYFTSGARTGQLLALDGAQFAELDSNNFNASIWQNIPTVSGQTYQVQFYWAARPGWPGDNQMEVSWNGHPFYTTPIVSQADAPEDSITWHEQNFIVKGAGATTELRFTQLGWANGRGTYLDKIKVALVADPNISFTSLAPAVESIRTGTSRTVTLTTTPQTPGIAIEFTVTGANPMAGGGVTGNDGVATFAYTGYNGGKDTITAVFGAQSLSVTKYWVEYATLTPELAFNPVGTSHTVTLTTVPPAPGVTVEFTVTGANEVGPTSGTTGDNGVVTFGYTGTNAGHDTITADLLGMSTSVEKYWLENFLTGGGSLKDPKFSFSGIVGKLDLGIVGYFQIVDHTQKGGSVTWVCDNDFSSLVFGTVDPSEITGGKNPPGATNNAAYFTGNFTNGTETIAITIFIVDATENGAKGDIIWAEFTSTEEPMFGGIMNTGNFQVHDAE